MSTTDTPDPIEALRQCAPFLAERPDVADMRMNVAAEFVSEDEASACSAYRAWRMATDAIRQAEAGAS